MNHEIEESAVLVGLEEAALPGDLTVPAEAIGAVLFAHGSGSSRRSTRNRDVARQLVQRGCATLLFDLLSEDEAEDRGNVFDIELLAGRMRAATEWLLGRPRTRDLPIGYFGASTGAAAALVAAAGLGDRIAAVVSRGGRPDLAGDALPRVVSPTLLIVGSFDEAVLELNRAAQRRLRCENRLVVVEGATHLFEEPGKLEEVARRAGEWFEAKLRRSRTGGGPGKPAMH
jgi:pimeloyl-ACP methyl ester carboxylesterase